MKPLEISAAVNEDLLGIVQKKVPFQSFVKGLSNPGKFVGYILKYGELSYEDLMEIEKEIIELKEERKKAEIEKTELELKQIQEKLKALKQQ